MILCWLVQWKKTESVDGRCFVVAKHCCCFNPPYMLAVFSSTGAVPWYSWDDFCYVSGWCFLFMSGSKQSTRFISGRSFFPQNFELRETFVASVYGWCCKLCEDLSLYYQFRACLFRGLAACWCFCLWHLILLASESWNALIRLQTLGSIQQCLGKAWECVVY